MRYLTVQAGIPLYVHKKWSLSIQSSNQLIFCQCSTKSKKISVFSLIIFNYDMVPMILKLIVVDTKNAFLNPMHVDIS